MQKTRLDPQVGKIPWRREWQPTPVLLPGESQGPRSLVGYSPGGLQDSDTTEPLALPVLLLAYLSLGITSREQLLALRVYSDPFSKLIHSQPPSGFGGTL